MASLKELTCSACGVVFGMPDEVVRVRRQDQGTFYCPHGHQQYFPAGPTEADKMRQERDRLKQQLAQKDDEIASERRRADREREAAEAAQRRVVAARGQVTKMKNRAAAGVCPCCNRSFENLRRHMSAKHPTFTQEQPDNVIPLKSA